MEVHSQTPPPAPYLSFMGETLPNHAYVDLTEVGTDTGDPGNTLRCHTDLSSCCSGGQGNHRGDWNFPDGSRPPFISNSVDFFETRSDQRVDLHRRNNANPPSGIYHCTIPTNAVNDENDGSVRETLYAGLYTTGGE